jgi:hypothetical protein
MKLQIAIAIATTLAMMIPSVSVGVFALDSEFDIKLTDFYENNNYKFCMTEEGSLPTPSDCVDRTGRELAAGVIPYFIAVGAQPNLSLVFSVEDTTNQTIIYRHQDDMPDNPEQLLFSMMGAEPGTTQYATEEVQTETETRTQTVETEEDTTDEVSSEDETDEDPTEDETDEVPMEDEGDEVVDEVPSVPGPSSTSEWMNACGTVQQFLYHSCDAYVNSDGTLTSEGERAVVCIRNGVVLAAGGTIGGVPPSMVTDILGGLAEMTGCGGIVDMQEVKQVVSLGGLTDLSQLTKFLP